RGTRPSGLPMPSMVVMLAFRASRPSTQHEFTSRPSMRTLQAPQFPLLQPSLLPVNPTRSRSTSSKLSRGSHRKSTGSPLIVALTAVLLLISSAAIESLLTPAPRSIHRSTEGAASEDADEMAAVLGGAAHVG